jgi:hypothetical protein
MLIPEEHAWLILPAGTSKLTIVGEVKAQLVGQHNRALLVHMVTQHLPAAMMKMGNV